MRNQQGIASLLLIVGVIVLIVGVAVGVFLVQQQQNLRSKASAIDPSTTQNSLYLEAPSNITGTTVGEAFSVKVYARTDFVESNLFLAKLSFPTEVVEVESIDYTNSFIQSWVEQFYDNSTGEISLVGGMFDPGYKTSPQTGGALIATINFKSKTTQATQANFLINFSADSAIYSNSDNQDIKPTTTGAQIALGIPSSPVPTPIASVEPSPVASPVASASPSPSPIASVPPSPVPSPSPLCEQTLTPAINTTTKECQDFASRCVDTGWQALPGASSCQLAGDFNGDGKVSIVDASKLYSQFNKEGNLSADLNGDQKVNTIDYGLMLNVFRIKKVIRSI